MAARTPKEREPAPPDQIAELEALLRQATALPRAIVVRGDERWFRERAVKLALDAAQRLGFEIVRHDALDPDFQIASLSADLSAAPMFASARLILVRNAAPIFTKEEGEAPPIQRAALAFLADTATAGTLVLEAPGLRADHALVKAAVARGGKVLSLRKLYDSPSAWNPDARETELARWLTGRARARKLDLSPDDAAWVVLATGNDLHALESALERLAQRGAQSVRDLVGWTSGGSPFDAAEMLCRGDARKSIAALEVLFRHGFQEKSGTRLSDRDALVSILAGSLRSKLRQTLTGALAQQRGMNAAEAAELARVPAYPKAREEFAARLAERPAAAWRSMLLDVIDLERSTRVGATVDAADFARLALRWRRRDATRARTN